MQLLEKDPEKRPASAADVLKALESIDLGKVQEGYDSSVTEGLNQGIVFSLLLS